MVPQAIDPARTIFRIDLRDYQWNAAVWRRAARRYPYGIICRPADGPARSAPRPSCELPYVRGDWFVVAASRPPLYHDVLQLPDDRPRAGEGAEDRRGRRTSSEERVARAGFNGSGVSRNNRLIERHESGYGAYWKSYDFAGNTGRQNLFAHPLGPGRTRTAFQHDGGEIIFNLPNGLQALHARRRQGPAHRQGADQDRQRQARPDRPSMNGISCMSCHARGMIDKADQVRAHVEKNPTAFTEADARTDAGALPAGGGVQGPLARGRGALPPRPWKRPGRRSAPPSRSSPWQAASRRSWT